MGSDGVRPAVIASSHWCNGGGGHRVKALLAPKSNPCKWNLLSLLNLVGSLYSHSYLSESRLDATLWGVSWDFIEDPLHAG